MRKDRLFIGLGTVLFVSAWIAFVVGKFADSLAAGLAAILFFLGAGIFLYRGRQHRAVAELADRSGDSRSPVLFLRSFRSDTSLLKEFLTKSGGLGLGIFSTDEEELAAALNPLGPLVAIGQPGEKLPRSGAARVYSGDRDWQSLVDQRLREARLVVIAADETAGLSWEIDRAFELLPPDRILVLMRFTLKPQYESLTGKIAGLTGKPFPGYDDLPWTKQHRAAFLYFEPDGAPKFAHLPKLGGLPWGAWRRAYAQGIDPVLKALEIPT